ncbi:hypothetical protein LINPERPRIM_LOCUS7876 [Linum perenne]
MLDEKLTEGLKKVASSPQAAQLKKTSPKSNPRFTDFDARSPFKFMNQIRSPLKAKTFGGKENKVKRSSSYASDFNFIPRPVLKPNNNPHPNSQGSDSTELPHQIVSEAHQVVNRVADVVFFFIFLLFEEELQQIQILSNYRVGIISQGRASQTNHLVDSDKSLNLKNSNNIDSLFSKFEFIDLTCRYELRIQGQSEIANGDQEMKVPLVFVKGRLIGGAADNVAKLDEEEKLEGMLSGIQRRLTADCQRDAAG